MIASVASSPPLGGSDLAAKRFDALIDQSGTTCVVTGGAKGIGAAVARRFADQGARVVLIDADAVAVHAAAARLSTESPATVTAATADVRDGAALLAAARAHVDGDVARLVWVNSAGIYPSHRFDALEDEHWRLVLGVNLDGSFHGAKAAVAIGDERRIGGVIVNVSSVAGSRAGYPPGIAHYVSSKHAVEGLTKALAVELGPRGWRVVAVAPGTVVTDGLVERFGPAGGDDDPYLALTRRMPIRRPALADDVARVVLFLASDAAAMVTGCTLPVDGGQLAT